MPLDLARLVAPDHTAVLTMELQRGVVGERSAIRELADEVERAGLVANTARLLAAARDVGVRVVHCTAQFRPDRAGSATNAPLLAVMAKQPGHIAMGSASAEVVPELGPDPRDLISPRVHGVSPFIGTELDSVYFEYAVARGEKEMRGMFTHTKIRSSAPNRRADGKKRHSISRTRLAKS